MHLYNMYNILYIIHTNLYVMYYTYYIIFKYRHNFDLIIPFLKTILKKIIWP